MWSPISIRLAHHTERNFHRYNHSPARTLMHCSDTFSHRSFYNLVHDCTNILSVVDPEDIVTLSTNTFISLAEQNALVVRISHHDICLDSCRYNIMYIIWFIGSVHTRHLATSDRIVRATTIQDDIDEFTVFAYQYASLIRHRSFHVKLICSRSMMYCIAS